MDDPTSANVLFASMFTVPIWGILFLGARVAQRWRWWTDLIWTLLVAAIVWFAALTWLQRTGAGDPVTPSIPERQSR